MKQKQVMLCEKIPKEHEFLDKLLENCNIDALTGRLYCKKCKNLVHVDWLRNLAYCGIHIISRSGVAYRNDPCEVYV